MSNVSQYFLDKLSYLRDNFRNDFKIIRSEYDMDDIDVENSEKHGPFLNGDFKAS